MGGKVYVSQPLELVLTFSSLKGVEAAIYSIKTIQEAIPVGPNQNLSRVFGPEVLGKLPMQGHEQIRRTALDLVGRSLD